MRRALNQSSFDRTHSCEHGESSFDGHRSDGVIALTDGLVSAARSIIAFILRWWRSRDAIRKLECLNDHYLLDIGIERCSITNFAWNEKKKDNISI